MAFGLHGKSWVESALACFVARLDFIDDVDTTLATDDLAGRVTLLGGFDGGNDFHKRSKNRERAHPCQTNIVAGTAFVWNPGLRWLKSCWAVGCCAKLNELNP